MIRGISLPFSRIRPMSEHQLLALANKPSWGMSLAVDLDKANPYILRSAVMLKDFARRLCSQIQMRSYGESQVVHFGRDPRVCGYTLTQLLETSNLSAHCVEQDNAVYVDLFSCAYYNPHNTALWIGDYFEAENLRYGAVLRGPVNKKIINKK